jgi:molybdate transport system permease protein
MPGAAFHLLGLLAPEEWQAVYLSAIVALTAVVSSLPFGIALGWLMARRDFWGKSLVETAINLPLVLPPVVTGYLLLVVFGRKGWLGGLLERWLDVRIVFTWKAAALASAVMAFPLMVKAIRLAFSSVDRRLELAARTLGAGPIDTFFSVSLPLARHGVLAGAILAFGRSMGEFGATIMVAGNIPGETQTIPLQIYGALESPGGMERAATMVLMAIVISVGALAAGELLERRGRARLEAKG